MKRVLILIFFALSAQAQVITPEQCQRDSRAMAVGPWNRFLEDRICGDRALRARAEARLVAMSRSSSVPALSIQLPHTGQDQFPEINGDMRMTRFSAECTFRRDGQSGEFTLGRARLVSFSEYSQRGADLHARIEKKFIRRFEQERCASLSRRIDPPVEVRPGGSRAR